MLRMRKYSSSFFQVEGERFKYVCWLQATPLSSFIIPYANSVEHRLKTPEDLLSSILYNIFEFVRRFLY